MIILALILLISLPTARAFRLRLIQTLPFSFCLLTCFLALLFRGLRLWSAITPSLMRVLCFFIVFSGGFMVFRRFAYSPLISYPSMKKWSAIEKTLFLLLCFLGVGSALNAFLFPPSNWDSMTYHMSRVAFWFQNHSIFPYVTNNPRQNLMTPGAEYLILTEQLIWNSDRWANCIQWIAVCTIGLGVSGWFTDWGLSRKQRLLLLATFLSAPMIVLQSHTTQNDLTASVPTLVLVLAVVDHFVKNKKAFSVRCCSYTVLAVPVAIAAGYLIKPTSLLISAPFLLALSPAYILTISRNLQSFFVLLASVILGLIGVMPILQTKLKLSGSIDYPGLATIGWWQPRLQLFNSIQHFADHLPMSVSIPIIAFFGKFFKVQPEILTILDRVFSQNTTEDDAGNPVQFLLAFLIVCISLVGFRNKKRFILGLSFMSAWIFFHAIINNQEWTSRLQTPWFISLLPLWGFFVFQEQDFFKKKWGNRLSLTISFICLGMAFYVLLGVTQQRFRQSLFRIPWSNQHRFQAYYLRRPGASVDPEKAPTRLKGCSTIYLTAGENDYDYPIAWADIQSGRKVEHLLKPPDRTKKKCTVKIESGNAF